MIDETFSAENSPDQTVCGMPARRRPSGRHPVNYRKLPQSIMPAREYLAAAQVVLEPVLSPIRTMYANLMKQDVMTVHFSTDEVVVANNLAYMSAVPTYILKIVDKASSKVLQDVKNKHLHILKRQPDGTWKTRGLMISSAEPTPGQR